MRNLKGDSVVADNPNATYVVTHAMLGEYTLILRDGGRQTKREIMNRGTGGMQAYLSPPLYAIERNEVVRGSMSSLYDSDAMGDVVNINSDNVPERLLLSATWGGIFHEDCGYNDVAGRKFIGRLARNDSFYSRVGVSGKRAAVHHPIANHSQLV